MPQLRLWAEFRHGGARATEYIQIYENKDIILQKLVEEGKVPEGTNRLSRKLAYRTLCELKREERGEPLARNV